MVSALLTEEPFKICGAAQPGIAETLSGIIGQEVAP
jgi:hypothetical protein